MNMIKVDMARAVELEMRLALLAGIATELAKEITEDNRRRIRAAMRRAAAEHLLVWCNRYMGPHFRLPPSELHVWLARELNAMRFRRGARLNVLAPRGFAKSTIGTLAFPLRAAAEGWERYIWILSDTWDQAAAHLENLKAELIDNGRLCDDYPEATGAGRVWRRGSIRLRNGVAVEAYGTGQRIRGRRFRADRPTLVICDDLESDRHVESAARRESTRRWFHGALLNAGSPETNIVHLATALHRDALAMTIAQTTGWTSRVFRAVESWPTNDTLWEKWQSIYCDLDDQNRHERARSFYDEHRVQMDAGARVLWPAREDLYALQRMRVDMGREAFEREKQNHPINPDACEWPVSYFGAHTWFDTWPARLRVKTMALDPSKGRGDRRGDFSAFVMLGVGYDEAFYLEADMARRATPQIVADGVEHCRLFAPDAFGIESTMYQDLLGELFEAEFRRQGMINARPSLLDNRVNKLVRIRRLGPYLGSRRLRFKTESRSTELLVEQLKDFPLGAHDDGPDAAEMALRLASELLAQRDIEQRPIERMIWP